MCPPDREQSAMRRVVIPKRCASAREPWSVLPPRGGISDAPGARYSCAADKTQLCSCIRPGSMSLTGGRAHCDPASTCGRAPFFVRRRTFSGGSPCRGARHPRAAGHNPATLERPKSIDEKKLRRDRRCAKPPKNLQAQLHTTALPLPQNDGKGV